MGKTQAQRDGTVSSFVVAAVAAGFGAFGLGVAASLYNREDMPDALSRLAGFCLFAAFLVGLLALRLSFQDRLSGAPRHALTIWARWLTGIAIALAPIGLFVMVATWLDHALP